MDQNRKRQNECWVKETWQEGSSFLPQSYRQAMILYYFEGLTQRQVAAQMQVSLDTARHHISKGVYLLEKTILRKDRNP